MKQENSQNSSLKTALVTGAGKRLGKAMAIALGDAGYRVAIHYNHSHEEAQAVASEINHAQKNQSQAIIVKADLSNDSHIDNLIDQASTALASPLSLLVNSASAFENDELSTVTRQSWDMHMNINLYAPVKLSQVFSGQCIKGENNLIINLIDQRVKKLTPQFLSYTTSKAALLTLTQTMAQALGPDYIRVNAIGPGPTLRNKRQSQSDWQIQNEATILGHGATPNDINQALLYLISAKSVTGQMIAVDGGQHLIWQTPDVLINE